MAEGEAAETPSTALVAVSPPSTLVAEDPAIEAAIKLLESRGIVAGRAAGDGRGGRTPAHGGRPGGAQGGVGGAEHVTAACTVRRVRTAHTPGGVLESPAGTTTSSTRVHDFKVRPTA